MDLPVDDIDLVKAELNAQTGKMEWLELARYFARGVVLLIDRDQDLVELAAHVVRDDSDVIKPLLESDKIIRPTDDHARDWEARQPLFWAVVASPWVLIQEIK